MDYKQLNDQANETLLVVAFICVLALVLYAAGYLIVQGLALTFQFLVFVGLVGACVLGAIAVIALAVKGFIRIAKHLESKGIL